MTMPEKARLNGAVVGRERERDRYVEVLHDVASFAGHADGLVHRIGVMAQQALDRTIAGCLVGPAPPGCAAAKQPTEAVTCAACGARVTPLVYDCAICGGTFTDPEPELAVEEATAVFQSEELEDAGRVCDDCFQDMRRAMPDFDARYQERGR